MVAQMSELDLPKAAVTRKVRGDIHFQCGRSLVEGGALEEAMEEFSEVLIHCPDNAMVGCSTKRTEESPTQCNTMHQLL